MSKILRRCAGLALLAAAGLGLASALPRTRPQTAAAPPAPTLPAAGLRVHIDPATGRMRPRPAPDAATPAAALLPAAHPGLVEEPGTTAAGGFKVNSRGKFQSAVVLRFGPDGKPMMTCLEGVTAQPQNR